MRQSLLLFIALIFFTSAFSQVLPYKPAPNEDMPLWQQLLYSENPQYQEVINAYEDYYENHPFEKTIHTQNFKRWIAQMRSSVDENGTIVSLHPEERIVDLSNRGSEIWTFAGPEHHVDADGSMTAGFRHANVYCHDRSATNPNLLFAGTESGGLYKTVDGGQNWFHVTKSLIIGSVGAVRIKPDNDNFVIMSAANDLWRSTDGGATWNVIGQGSFISQNISAWEIAYNPDNTSMIYAATNQGLFRSLDDGDNWTEILPNNTECVAIKPNDHSVIYTIHFDNAVGYSRFYKSTDYGATFTLFENGWFDSSMGNIDIQGGRLAVTEADPNRIYALLVGYENTGSSVITNGWVGTWVSYDAGATWTFPHGLIGTPYTEDHPNLMNFDADDGTYTQIHYNTTMAASQLDPDKVLIGGLNLWVSHDACATYEGVGGYIGGIPYFHVDQQEIRIYKTGDDSEEIWIGNDGGILHSSDFMENHDNLNRGIQAVNLWGYDQGWNEDIMVGGRYHNGNMAYHQNYPSTEFLALGGGEAPTGYVNYSNQKKTYFSDIGGKILPETLDETPTNFSVSLSPNESYWNNGSSRIMFDNSYFNIAWLGRENKLYRSTDGGSTFQEMYAFGNNPNDDVLWIEQSYSNYDYMYLHQAYGNQSKMWQSTDHGETWNEINIPLTLRNMNFTLSATNENELWVAYFDGGNGQKIYKTNNAGTSWDNLTTSTLNGKSIWAIAHQYGTNGGVYAATRNGNVYYRNAALNDWVDYSSGLPASSEPLRIVPFYNGSKIRLATWNLGVWEAPLYEPSEMIANFAAVTQSYQCPGEPVYFVDHSVAPEGTTYEWTFPGGTPSSSIEQNPVVYYDNYGEYSALLTITYQGNISTAIKTNYISIQSEAPFTLSEDFEVGGFQQNWNRTENSRWTVNQDASAYGVGAYSAHYDNYYYDAQGTPDAFITPKMAGYENNFLSFDVAYARYGAGYSDTLDVAISCDCGVTWTSVFHDGGESLATSPDQGGYFVPTSDQWETHSFALPYCEDFLLKFSDLGYYGNTLYIDNINVSVEFAVNDASNPLSNIVIFPNPTNGEITLGLGSSFTNGLHIQLFDVLGKLVFENTLTGASTMYKMDLSNWSNGAYMLKIQDENGWTRTQQILKK